MFQYKTPLCIRSAWWFQSSWNTKVTACTQLTLCCLLTHFLLFLAQFQCNPVMQSVVNRFYSCSHPHLTALPCIAWCPQMLVILFLVCANPWIPPIALNIIVSIHWLFIYHTPHEHSSNTVHINSPGILFFFVGISILFIYSWASVGWGGLENFAGSDRYHLKGGQAMKSKNEVANPILLQRSTILLWKALPLTND